MAETDYRAICLELFGTDDVEKLKMIAKQIRQKNTRNAGRKRKFNEAETEEMKRLQRAGMTVNDIARRFGTSRQVIGKYLNAPLPEGYTMRMTYMFRRQPCTTIDVDFLRRNIRIQNKTDDILHRAFGTNEQPTWDDFECFLQERCFPKTRGRLKDELRALGLDSYDPLQIVEKTNGRTAEDDLWLKIQYSQT